VRDIRSPRRLRTAADAEDFEQEIIDQYALSMAALGITDGHIAVSRPARSACWPGSTTSWSIRRLCDLFGLSVGGVTRYAVTRNQPGLDEPGP